jgi:hypothetical protein
LHVLISYRRLSVAITLTTICYICDESSGRDKKREAKTEKRPEMGRAIAKGPALNEKQAGMLADILAGIPPIEAARRQGYLEPHVTAKRFMQRPDVLLAIKRDSIGQLVGEGVPLAISTLFTILKDEAAPARVRVDAAKTVLDRAGIAAARPAAPEKASEKALSEMSPNELRALISRLENEVAERAAPVLATDSGGDGAEPIDILD